MGMPLLEAVHCREAIAKFLTSIHPLLPPYWYKLQGDDVGSLAFLFGLSEAELEALFLRAGILKHVTRKKMPKKYVYFLHLGSSTSAHGWEACKNGAAQVRQNIRPPCARIYLSRFLFMECDAVSTILEDYMAAAKPAPALMAATPVTAPSTSPGPNLLTSVTSCTQTEEPSITPSTSSTPYLDNFVGSRDKANRKKLEEVLLDTVSILAPGRGQ
jgi:hypothetical protein